MKKKILIIGGTGFIGKHLVKKCVSLKWKVTSVSSSKPKDKVYKVQYIICDISKKKQIYSKIKKNYNYVVNLGGYVDHSKRQKTYNTHYIGLKNLSNFFLKSKIESFLQMGSSLEYGDLSSPQKETMLTNPNKLKSVYAKSKLLATYHLIKLNKNYNFPMSVLRLYLAYGPKQDFNRFLPVIIKSCLQNKSFDCSEGNQFRDFIFINDLIDIIIKALKNRNRVGQVINVGSGKKQKIRNIIKMVVKITKGGNPNFGKIKLRKDETLKIYPSISKAKKILKWKPKINITQLVDDMISQEMISLEKND